MENAIFVSLVQHVPEIEICTHMLQGIHLRGYLEKAAVIFGWSVKLSYQFIIVPVWYFIWSVFAPIPLMD